MKKSCIISSLLLALSFLSCDRIMSGPPSGKGFLQLAFEPPSSRTMTEIPDTNLFMVEIAGASGKSVFSGIYSSLPEQMELQPGDYTVSAISRKFSEPLFDAQQFGDYQTFTIESGVISAVHLSCSQLNAGVRLQTGINFRAEYPDGTFYLHSAAGSLVYAYGEKRTGYFKPGPVWLEFSYGGNTSTLLTRELAAREILILRIDAGNNIKEVSSTADKYGEGFSMEIDTSLNYTAENFFFNSGGSGSEGDNTDLSGALSVGEARSKASESPTGVWVYGYIAGGDCTANGCSFSPPFKSATNLVLSPTSTSADKESCLAVQLQKGDIRGVLNLVDHPENLGRLVYLKGDLVPKYYGIPGLQNISDYRLK